MTRTKEHPAWTHAELRAIAMGAIPSVLIETISLGLAFALPRGSEWASNYLVPAMLMLFLVATVWFPWYALVWYRRVSVGTRRWRLGVPVILWCYVAIVVPPVLLWVWVTVNAVCGLLNNL